MHLLTLIFGIVLLTKAHTLKCNQCDIGNPGSCAVKECPLAGQRCSALRLTSYAGGSKIMDVTTKSCVMAEECVEASVNFGISQTVIKNECCNSDFCNDKLSPVPSKTGPNGKKCFQCNGQDCTATLNCEGTQDHCLSGKVNTGSGTVTLKGCVSKLLCSPGNQDLTRTMGTDMSCCQGDYCNSASIKSAGILLLVAPLFSLVVLS
ncbi:uncharacterized protein LOC129110163 [Anoplopoma fimbria]|uniref:uncharacterized protein LOC129110163 n=1 Tax=Anoplopoma fimbria TaxID=229290 RepID=UPI0023EE185A|nr:uncharacterized protein LOC129110163 [Anoplopoma fimbria]